ncbi:protein kinase domain-containing protein [Agromyces soli]
MRRAPAAPPELPGYEYLSLLGSGGFADVFLYEQKLPRRRVAVKVLIADELSRDTRAQFVAEANLMAQLSAHPYIVTIFHADVAADGRPYFVMEYCSGPSLATRLKREPFGVEDALRTGVRLAGAVATAHAAGILHRDIKPANVLTNDYGWPALTDFGISSTLEGELPLHTMTFLSGGDPGETGGQSAIGLSVPWSPPEMFDDDPRPDARSDVFALAATVHTLLAGRSPFEIPGRSNGSLDLMGRIERGAVTPIGRADVPRSLVEALRAGMAVRREDRTPSAIAFARALQRVELELGYAPTAIDVPEQAVEAPPAPDGRSDVDADATRARAVQQIVAQPDADRTRARTPQSIVAQPAVVPSAQPFARPGGASSVDDRTVVRPVAVDQTVLRQAESPVVAAPVAAASPVPTAPAVPGAPAPGAPLAAPARRSRVGLVVGIVAGVLVVAAIGIAVLFSGSLGQRGDDSADDDQGGGEDAIVAATVPAPSVAPGVPSPDGASVVFAVAADDRQDGDRYRWSRADGTGGVELAEGDEIVVTGVAPGQTVCIDVQLQRGSKTSESVRGCTP